MAGTRAGRRERTRSTYGRRPFLQRYRGLIMTLAVVAGVGVIGAFMIGQASAKTYVCGVQWDPPPTPSPDPAASPEYGVVQPDMGRQHAVSQPQRYQYCPPASGNHYAQPRAPIPARFYGRDDFTEPAGWIHNLEHGGLVILYRGQEAEPGGTDAVQDELRTLWGNLPPSPVCNLQPGRGAGPVIARFDDMAYPFAALIWNRVLPLDSLDVAAIEQFWLAEGEHASVPEQPCLPPSPSPGASPIAPPASPAPTAAAPSASPAASPAAS